MTYLSLDISVSKASMLQHIALFAPAPVFAAVMAMHALDKKVPGGLDVRGVGLIHKKATPWVELIYESKFEPTKCLFIQRRGAVPFSHTKDPNAVPLQPAALTDLEWTLLLRCGNSDLDPHAIKSIVETMRLAGGQIRRCTVNLSETLQKALELVHGYWVEDATDLLAAHPGEVAQLLKKPCNEFYLVPANLGYALLEPPGARSGARDEANHAFAENMLGLVRFVPMRTARTTIDENSLWHFGWDADQFLVTNRPAVVPILKQNCLTSCSI